MGAEKKINPDHSPAEPKHNEPVQDWKKKKLDRQKLLRAIRAKSFTDTIRGVIRKEVKKGQPIDE